MQGAANGLSAIFFSMAYMQFLGLAECADCMLRLPVFYKQKYTLLFPGWAYSIPFATIHIPRALLEVTMWSGLVYWVVGFEPDASRCAPRNVSCFVASCGVCSCSFVFSSIQSRKCKQTVLRLSLIHI